MIKNLVRSIIACSFLFVSASAYAWDVSGYKGPTMDLSKYQPEMRLGFLGDESAQDIIKNNACLKEYAEVAYGVPAKIYTFKDYAGTMESMLGGSLDYAWFGSSGYAGVYLEDPTAAVPILTRMQPTGDMGYYSVMVTRADSGINSLDDLKGKSFGWADPNSTSGYLIPSIELKAAGMDPDSYFYVNPDPHQP